MVIVMRGAVPCPGFFVLVYLSDSAGFRIRAYKTVNGKVEYREEWITAPLSVEMIQDVDKSEVVGAQVMQDL